MKKILLIFLLFTNIIFADNYYSILVDSFNDKDKADAKIKKLKKNNLYSFFKINNIKNKNWYRVFIGKFKNKKIAEKYADFLLKKEIIDYKMIYKLILKNDHYDFTKNNISKIKISTKKKLKTKKKNIKRKKTQKNIINKSAEIKLKKITFKDRLFDLYKKNKINEIYNIVKEKEKTLNFDDIINVLSVINVYKFNKNNMYFKTKIYRIIIDSMLDNNMKKEIYNNELSILNLNPSKNSDEIIVRYKKILKYSSVKKDYYFNKIANLYLLNKKYKDLFIFISHNKKRIINKSNLIELKKLANNFFFEKKYKKSLFLYNILLKYQDKKSVVFDIENKIIKCELELKKPNIALKKIKDLLDKNIYNFNNKYFEQNLIVYINFKNKKRYKNINNYKLLEILNKKILKKCKTKTIIKLVKKYNKILYENLANLYFKKKDFKNSEKYYKKIGLTKKQLIEKFFNYYYKLNKLDSLLYFIEQSYSLNEQSQQIEKLINKTYSEKKYKQTIKLINYTENKQFKIQNQNQILIDCLIKLNKITEVTNKINYFLTKYGQSPEINKDKIIFYRLKLIDIFIKNKKYKEALSQNYKLLKQSQNTKYYIQVLYKRAIIYENLKLKNTARKWFKKVLLTLEKDNEYYKLAETKLKQN